VQDRDIVTMDDKYEIINGLSNDVMTLSKFETFVIPVTHKYRAI